MDFQEFEKDWTIEFASLLRRQNVDELYKLYVELWNCRCCTRHQFEKTTRKYPIVIPKPTVITKIYSREKVMSRLIARKRTKTSPPKLKPRCVTNSSLPQSGCEMIPKAKPIQRTWVRNSSTICRSKE